MAALPYNELMRQAMMDIRRRAGFRVSVNPF